MPVLKRFNKPLTRVGQGYTTREVEVGVLVRFGEESSEEEGMGDMEPGQAEEATTIDRCTTYTGSTSLEEDEDQEDIKEVGDLLSEVEQSSSGAGEGLPASKQSIISEEKTLGEGPDLTILDIFDPLQDQESGELGGGADTFWDLTFPIEVQPSQNGIAARPGANFAEEIFYQSALAADDAQLSPNGFISGSGNFAEEVFYRSALAAIEAIIEEELTKPSDLAEKDDIAPDEEVFSLGVSGDVGPAEVLNTTGVEDVASDEVTFPCDADSGNSITPEEEGFRGTVEPEGVCAVAPTELYSSDDVDSEKVSADVPTGLGSDDVVLPEEDPTATPTELPGSDGEVASGEVSADVPTTDLLESSNEATPSDEDVAACPIDIRLDDDAACEEIEEAAPTEPGTGDVIVAADVSASPPIVLDEVPAASPTELGTDDAIASGEVSPLPSTESGSDDAVTLDDTSSASPTGPGSEDAIVAGEVLALSLAETGLDDGLSSDIVSPTGPDASSLADDVSVPLPTESGDCDGVDLNKVYAASPTEMGSDGDIVASKVSTSPPTESGSTGDIAFNKAYEASPTEQEAEDVTVADEVFAPPQTESGSDVIISSPISTPNGLLSVAPLTPDEVSIQITPDSIEVMIPDEASTPNSLNSGQVQEIAKVLSPTSPEESEEVLTPNEVVSIPSGLDCVAAIVTSESEVPSPSDSLDLEFGQLHKLMGEVKEDQVQVVSEPDTVPSGDQAQLNADWAKDTDIYSFFMGGEKLVPLPNQDQVPVHMPDAKGYQKKALDLVVHSYPTSAGLIWDMTCIACWKNSGPPSSTCSFGHMICSPCQKGLESASSSGSGMGTCPAQVDLGDGVTQGNCSGELQLIDEAVKKTPYFKYFMEHAKYKCAAKRWGCNAGLLPGLEIENHEMFGCRFNFIHHCQFQREGCSAIFKSLRNNLFHLLTVHQVPISFDSEGYFLVRYGYGRTEGLGEEQDPRSMHPVIRAVVQTRRKNISCYLIAEDMRDFERNEMFTRILLLNIFTLKKDYLIKANLSIRRESHVGGEMRHESFQEAELLVLPSVKDLGRLDELKAKYDMDVYLDIDHRRLDEVTREKPAGKKYFPLMVLISLCKSNFNGGGGKATSLPEPVLLLDRAESLPKEHLDLEDDDEEEVEFEEGEAEDDEGEVGDDEEESKGGEEDSEEGEDEDADDDEDLDDGPTPDYDSLSAVELEEEADRLEGEGRNLKTFDPSRYYMVSDDDDDHDQLELEQRLKDKRRKLLELAGILRAKAQQKRREDDEGSASRN